MRRFLGIEVAHVTRVSAAAGRSEGRIVTDRQETLSWENRQKAPVGNLLDGVRLLEKAPSLHSLADTALGLPLVASNDRNRNLASGHQTQSDIIRPNQTHMRTSGRSGRRCESHEEKSCTAGYGK